MRRFVSLVVLAAAVVWADGALGQAATPTPDVSGTAGRIRLLNRVGHGVSLGQIVDALWRGRVSGGELSVNGGDPTKLDIAPGQYRINSYVLNAAGTSGLAIAAGVTTGSAEYMKASVCVSASETYRFEPGTKASSQSAALQPPCADSEAEVGYLEIPENFTPGTTNLTSGMLKQNATKASQIVW